MLVRFKTRYYPNMGHNKIYEVRQELNLLMNKFYLIFDDLGEEQMLNVKDFEIIDNRIELKNINLDKVSFVDQVLKAEEEQEEFWKAIEDNDKAHIIEELWDEFQAKLGVVEKMGINTKSVMNGYTKHLEKMENRPRRNKDE